MQTAAEPLSRRTVLQMICFALGGALPVGIHASVPDQEGIDADPLRPRYHLMPRRGWMNDPCAPVFYRGRYHLFFQYNPGASVWGDMHWAHAVSVDMVHWTARPIALAPTPGGPDSFGVFTGSMVFDHGTPTILYTCVSPSSKQLSTLWGSQPPEREQQCLATPADARGASPDAALDGWNKLPKPVITTPPPGMQVTGFRDPVPWQEKDGSFYMLLASGQKGVGGNVLLYKSADLRQWSFQHIFAEGKATGKQTEDTVDSGEMWECPDFFPLGDRHVLIHSTGTANGRETLWQTGRLDRRTMRWTPENEGVLNHGPYYAPKTQTDAAGNRILWGWIEERRPEAEFAKAGWAGCMSLPRVLTIRDGALRYAPADQVAGLRNGGTDTDAAARETVLEVVRGHASQPGYQSRSLRVTSGSDSAMRWNHATVLQPTELPASFTLRCFIDHSVIEVFVGDRTVLTARVYGDEPAHLELPLGFAVQESKSYAMQTIG